MLFKRAFFLLVFCLAFGLAAHAQETGYIDCYSHAESTPVLARAAKESAVVTTIDCGERFTVLLSGQFFSRIRTKDDKVGFINTYLISRDDSPAPTGLASKPLPQPSLASTPPKSAGTSTSPASRSEADHVQKTSPPERKEDANRNDGQQTSSNGRSSDSTATAPQDKQELVSKTTTAQSQQRRQFYVNGLLYEAVTVSDRYRLIATRVLHACGGKEAAVLVSVTNLSAEPFDFNPDSATLFDQTAQQPLRNWPTQELFNHIQKNGSIWASLVAGTNAVAADQNTQRRTDITMNGVTPDGGIRLTGTAIEHMSQEEQTDYAIRQAAPIVQRTVTEADCVRTNGLLIHTLMPNQTISGAIFFSGPKVKNKQTSVKATIQVMGDKVIFE